METKQDAALRVVGGLYESLAAPEAIAQEFVNSASNLPLDKPKILLEGHRALLAGLARLDFAQAGLPLNKTELPQAVASIKTAALAARDLH